MDMSEAIRPQVSLTIWWNDKMVTQSKVDIDYWQTELVTNR